MPGEVRFDFEATICKAYTDGAGKKHVVGIASDTLVDRQKDRMSPAAIKKMAAQINAKSIPLLPSHRETFELGWSTGAEVKTTPDGTQQLAVDFVLDDSDFRSAKLYNEVASGSAPGRQLSIGGGFSPNPQNFRYVRSKETGDVYREIGDITLDHIACTRPDHAANPRTKFIQAITKAMESVPFEVTEKVYTEEEFVAEMDQLIKSAHPEATKQPCAENASLGVTIDQKIEEKAVDQPEDVEKAKKAETPVETKTDTTAQPTTAAKTEPTEAKKDTAEDVEKSKAAKAEATCPNCGAKMPYEEIEEQKCAKCGTAIPRKKQEKAEAKTEEKALPLKKPEPVDSSDEADPTLRKPKPFPPAKKDDEKAADAEKACGKKHEKPEEDEGKKKPFPGAAPLFKDPATAKKAEEVTEEKGKAKDKPDEQGKLRDLLAPADEKPKAKKDDEAKVEAKSEVSDEEKKKAPKDKPEEAIRPLLVNPDEEQRRQRQRTCKAEKDRVVPLLKALAETTEGLPGLEGFHSACVAAAGDGTDASIQAALAAAGQSPFALAITEAMGLNKQVEVEKPAETAAPVVEKALTLADVEKLIDAKLAAVVKTHDEALAVLKAGMAEWKKALDETRGQVEGNVAKFNERLVTVEKSGAVSQSLLGTNVPTATQPKGVFGGLWRKSLPKGKK